MVSEVAAQVVLALVCLHQVVHLLVVSVLLKVGVGTWDSALQVIQLGEKQRMLDKNVRQINAAETHTITD